MATFTFDAPMLFDSAPSFRAGQKRLMCWLRDRLASRGVDAFGPVADPAGWRLAVNAEDGFVTIVLDRDGGGGKPFTVVVDKLGEADAEYDDTVAAFEDALSGARAGAQFECDLSA
jgi:hypothetical protein